MDNPPIAQMLRLHKQLSDKKSNGIMSSEEERMMLTRQDEMMVQRHQLDMSGEAHRHQ